MSTQPDPKKSQSHGPPDLSFVIPAWNENRWSDLLASLIKTDPAPIARLIGGTVNSVRREVSVPGATGKRRDRLDLLLERDGEQVAAIEAKVLSDLGADQLIRYREAFPTASSHWVLHLRQLPVNYLSAPGWSSLAWEDVLDAYVSSAHPWVSTTARAWVEALVDLVPQVSSGTVWNDLSNDPRRFELELRARTAWLSHAMDDWCQFDHRLEMSSGGGAWVASMRSPQSATGHRVVAEIQEGLPAIAWKPDPAQTYRDRVLPIMLVGLGQYGVSNSSGFDWAQLLRLFSGRVFDQHGAIIDGRQWQPSSANPKDATDRANWKATVAAGAPVWLGKGYGNATAQTHQVCVFGARLTLDPTLTLAEIDGQLRDIHDLVQDMASAAG